MDKPEWRTIRKDESNIIEQLIDNGFDVRAFNETHRTTFGYTVSNRNAQKIDFDNPNSYRAASGYADMKAAKIAARRALEQMVKARNAALARTG